MDENFQVAVGNAVTSIKTKLLGVLDGMNGCYVKFNGVDASHVWLSKECMAYAEFLICIPLYDEKPKKQEDQEE